MKFLIWVGCVAAYSILTVLLKSLGVLLGAIPTLILCIVFIFLLPKILFKKYDYHKERKSEYYVCSKKLKTVVPNTQDDAASATQPPTTAYKQIKVHVKQPENKPKTTRYLWIMIVSIVAFLLLCCCIFLGYNLKTTQTANETLGAEVVAKADEIAELNRAIEQIRSLQSSSNNSSYNSGYFQGYEAGKAAGYNTGYVAGQEDARKEYNNKEDKDTFITYKEYLASKTSLDSQDDINSLSGQYLTDDRLNLLNRMKTNVAKAEKQ